MNVAGLMALCFGTIGSLLIKTGGHGAAAAELAADAAGLAVVGVVLGFVLELARDAALARVLMAPTAVEVEELAATVGSDGSVLTTTVEEEAAVDCFLSSSALANNVAANAAVKASEADKFLVFGAAALKND